MGGHPAQLRDGRVVPAQAYDDRVLRDKRYKVWVGPTREITRLFDMQADPWEEQNLIDSNAPEHRAANQKFQSIIEDFPEQDATPKYEPNPAQPWDRAEK